jgi:hypothetical protein
MSASVSSRRQGAQAPEEGANAQQDQRADHGLDVRFASARRTHMRQQLQCHQRVGVDCLGQRVRIDLILVQGQLGQGLRGDREHRHRCVSQARDPGRRAGQRFQQPRRHRRRHGGQPAVGVGAGFIAASRGLLSAAAAPS